MGAEQAEAKLAAKVQQPTVAIESVALTIHGGKQVPAGQGNFIPSPNLATNNAAISDVKLQHEDTQSTSKDDTSTSYLQRLLKHLPGCSRTQSSKPSSGVAKVGEVLFVHRRLSCAANIRPGSMHSLTLPVCGEDVNMPNFILKYMNLCMHLQVRPWRVLRQHPTLFIGPFLCFLVLVALSVFGVLQVRCMHAVCESNRARALLAHMHMLFIDHDACYVQGSIHPHGCARNPSPHSWLSLRAEHRA